MTLTKAIHDISEQLSDIYEKNEADTIAELLLENITDSKKTDRILNKDKELTGEQIEKFNQSLPRLLNHEPIQYVLNECWFFGLKFYVDKNVLIPRPETEEMVDWVIRNIKFPFKELKILDIGTGSGCIPVSLKRKLRKAEVWACDISNEALAVAKRNADNLQADINFIQLDFLNEVKRNKLPSFDIIVSNPPYIPEENKAQMQPNVLKYEPFTALFVPNNDPLVFYKAIADFGKEKLNTGGAIYLEIHEDFGEATTCLFQSKGYTTELKKDMQGKDRMLKTVV